MLTKDLLKYRLRAGRVFPQFVAEDDAEALALAADLIAVFQDAPGKMMGEIEAAADELAETPLAAGLTKLLVGGLTLTPDDGDVAERRWRAIAAGQALRREAGATPGTPEDYRAVVAASIASGAALSAAELGAALYADLPEARPIAGTTPMTPLELIRRYNVAQVQGLLVRARSVTLTVTDDRVAARRELFRQLKFHRLLVDVTESDPLTISMSGPLSLFDQAAGYGLRLANFFPHVLHLASWSLVADLRLKEKTINLKLDHKAGLSSHYAQHTPYIPQEFLALVDAFNAMPHAMRVAPATDYVHVGKQSYCVPDLTISGYGPTPVHVELFHRWHDGQLAGRVAAAAAGELTNLRLGVSRSLAKRPEITALLAGSSWFGKYGFVFSEFPTPKCLLSVLPDKTAGKSTGILLKGKRGTSETAL